jgi:hypothetical protein
MSYDLEQRASQPAFKSYGEQRIAGVLDQYGIRYQYERPIVVIEKIVVGRYQRFRTAYR